jgi:aminoglycoside phosphotransferase (APT) family kinase protein
MAETGLHALVRRINPAWRLLHAQPLHGGVSARVTALDVADARGRVLELVLRAHGAADVAGNPHVAQDEYHLLAYLHRAGLRVPEPLAWGQIDAAPSSFVLVSRVAGAPALSAADPVPHACRMADFLLELHALEPSPALSSRLSDAAGLVARRLKNPPASMDASLCEGEIRTALRPVWPLPARNASALLHGDFWPGNVLWQDARLTGVVDWEDAALGEPLADVGNARLELLWAWGEAAMDAFTRRYSSGTACDVADLPYWDLCAALRPAGKLSSWGLDEAAKRAMREKHRWFVGRALQQLAAR